MACYSQVRSRQVRVRAVGQDPLGSRRRRPRRTSGNSGRAEELRGWLQEQVPNADGDLRDQSHRHVHPRLAGLQEGDKKAIFAKVFLLGTAQPTRASLTDAIAGIMGFAGSKQQTSGGCVILPCFLSVRFIK